MLRVGEHAGGGVRRPGGAPGAHRPDHRHRLHQPLVLVLLLDQAAAGASAVEEAQARRHPVGVFLDSNDRGGGDVRRRRIPEHRERGAPVTTTPTSYTCGDSGTTGLFATASLSSLIAVVFGVACLRRPSRLRTASLGRRLPVRGSKRSFNLGQQLVQVRRQSRSLRRPQHEDGNKKDKNKVVRNQRSTKLCAITSVEFLCFPLGKITRGEQRRGGRRNDCYTISNLRLLLFLLPVPAGPPALHKEKALQGHGHGAPAEGEPVRRELVEAVVRRGHLRGGERGGAGGRVQEAGGAQGAEHRGEGRPAVQGGAARRDALLAGEARPALQGRGPRPPQPRGERRRRLPLCARLRVPAPPRVRHRRCRRRAGRLRGARRSPGRRRGAAPDRRRRAVRRLRRPRRPAGVGLVR